MRSAALVAVLALAVGCDKEGDDGAGGGDAWPGASAADIARALEAVPEEAVGVAVLTAPRSFWSYLLDSPILPMSADGKAALDKDLRTVLGGQLGLDLSKARGAIGFVLYPAGGAAVFRDVSGTLKGASGDAPIALDGELVAGHRGNALAVGLDPAVRAALAVAGGKGKSLAAGKPQLAKWIAEQGTGSWVVLAGTPGAAPVPEPFSRIERVALAIGPRRARLVAEGDPAALQALAKQIEAGLAMAMAEIEEMKTAAMKGELPAPLGALSVYQYHQMKNLAAQVRPKVSGNRLSIEVPVDLGSNAMVFVAIVGVMAAVAIPSFMKYVKKSKSTEANIELLRLRTGVENYLIEHGELPAAAGPSPPLGSCCAAGDSTCIPDPAHWANPTWQALRFSIDEPNRYSYELATAGGGYTVRAYGDLDCDGVYSTFTLSSGSNDVLETDPLE